jgi:hypothetical protein
VRINCCLTSGLQQTFHQVSQLGHHFIDATSPVQGEASRREENCSDDGSRPRVPLPKLVPALSGMDSLTPWWLLSTTLTTLNHAPRRRHPGQTVADFHLIWDQPCILISCVDLLHCNRLRGIPAQAVAPRQIIHRPL